MWQGLRIPLFISSIATAAPESGQQHHQLECRKSSSMSFRDASDPQASDDEPVDIQEAREALRQSENLLKELNQRLDDTFKVRFFGDRCLDQLSSLLCPTLSGAPSGVPKVGSISTTERYTLVRTDPETSRIVERFHDVEVQGNSIYIAVARLIAHLLSSTVDRPLPENTKDPDSFLHLCFPSSFHEFWGVRCPAWQEWPEDQITSEDVFELISHSAQLSPLLRITDRPAELIDLLSHPSLAPAREALMQAGQVAIIDTKAMQRLGVRYGRSTVMADRYPSRAEGSIHVGRVNQQAPASIVADQGNGKQMAPKKTCGRNKNAVNRTSTSGSLDRRTVDPRPGCPEDRRNVGPFDNLPRKQDRRRYVNPQALRPIKTDQYSYGSRNRPESIRNHRLNTDGIPAPAR